MTIFTKTCKKHHFNWNFTEEKPPSLPMVRDFKKQRKIEEIWQENQNWVPHKTYMKDLPIYSFRPSITRNRVEAYHWSADSHFNKPEVEDRLNSIKTEFTTIYWRFFKIWTFSRKHAIFAKSVLLIRVLQWQIMKNRPSLPMSRDYNNFPNLTKIWKPEVEDRLIY